MHPKLKFLPKLETIQNIRKTELEIVCALWKTSIDNIIKVLKEKGYIERVGSNKTGYWKVND